MDKAAVFRLAAVAIIIAALGFSGLVDFTLPWADADFQATGVTVLVYFLWSLAAHRSTGRSSARLAVYGVLLVSAVDSMLLGITDFDGPAILRWAGVAILALGAGSSVFLRGGRMSPWQIPSAISVGIALGLGSWAGLAASVPAMVVAILSRDEAGDGEGPEEEPGEVERP